MGVTVTIRGKEFPLCLTVAALDKINDQCGGLGGIMDFLKGCPSGTVMLKEDHLDAAGVSKEQWEAEKMEAASRAKCNNAWMLGLLVQEGEENRLIEARFEDGADRKRRQVPSPEDMVHLLTPGQIEGYRLSILRAVTEGMKRTFEAESSKNVDQAEER
jgi:hypothetical protein